MIHPLTTLPRFCKALALLVLLSACASHEPVYRQIPTTGFSKVVGYWHQQMGVDTPDQPSYSPQDILPIADNLLLMQRNNGGWPAYLNPFLVLSSDERLQYLKDQNAKDASFRHHNIFPQVFYLSHVYLQTGDVRYRNAARKAIRLILASQVYNGGWTLQASASVGDEQGLVIDTGATLDALSFLRKVAAGEMPYGYISFDMRRQAAEAVRKGDQLLLRLQQAHNSRLSVWASAYSLDSSLPVAAEDELIAALNVPLSVRLAQYFMAVKRPPAELVRSINGAVSWLQNNSLHSWLQRQQQSARGPSNPLTLPKSEEYLADTPIWAQRYNITDSSPLRASFSSSVRTSWFAQPQATGVWPQTLLQSEYPQWRSATLSATIPRSPPAP